MFSRFRNLFAKAKSENSPEPEVEPETVNATKNGHAQTNGGNEQPKLENENKAQVNTVNMAEEGNTLKKEEEENERYIDSAAKVERSEITQQNVHPSNGQLTQALSTVIVENALTTTEINSTACDNKNEVGEESINTTIKNEKASGEDFKATYSVGVGEVDNKGQERVEENAPNTNGSEVVVELVKVDTAHIEVNTQSAEEVVEKINGNENENNLNENESAEVLPLLREVAQNETEVENIVSPNTLNNNINKSTEAVATPANKIEIENSLEQIIESTTLANVNEVSQIPSSSITVDELATDTSSSPAADRLTQSSSSPAGTVDSSSTADSNTIVIKPTGNNNIACAAISNKLQEIAEVAETLDAAIRDVQQDAEALEVQVPSTAEKKREAMRSISSEDWHSRSTEDDSFVTASEGNFTPHSHSSSYQTASGRTSSYISSVKSSFDVSEADDSTFASTYDIPVDLNMSYDGSEHSFASAQQQQPEATTSPHEREFAANEESCTDGAYALPNTRAEHVDDGSSIADIEELHSQSVTPTPGDGDVEQFHCQSIPVESETEELDSSSTGIVDAPSLQVLTEVVPITSVTPEVSTCSSTDQQQKPQQQQLSLAQQQQQQTHANNNNTNTNNNNTNNSNINTTATTANNQKPNAAWRRSKYYENITKQTIKGFL
uniref:Uncharacterized protein n=1 Tax=Ceratitis capitata TaxID=7213 RepID=W8B8Q5_CERCA